METCSQLAKNWYNVSSYRTYEEWKHANMVGVAEEVIGSYRTYEEWKHVSSLSVVTGFHGSYRTYEEWKLINNWYDVDYNESSYRTYEEWKHSFMRLPDSRGVKFLPYLWGMETFYME